jgi:hypothetical protein
MKYIYICLLLFAQVGFSAVKWDAQEVNTTYKLNKKITLQLDDKKYDIVKDTQFELVEVSDLNMIKVHLHKYKINNCPSPNIETDLQLINIRQSSRRRTSVGVNLTRNCIVEIFVDMKEYSTLSFLD